MQLKGPFRFILLGWLIDLLRGLILEKETYPTTETVGFTDP